MVFVNVSVFLSLYFKVLCLFFSFSVFRFLNSCRYRGAGDYGGAHSVRFMASRLRRSMASGFQPSMPCAKSF